MTLRDSLTVSPSVDITEVNLNSWQIGKLLADHSLQQSAVLYFYGDIADAHSAVAGSSRERKRKAALEPRSQMEPQAHEDTHGPSTTGKRKPRKCRNCQSTQCAGRRAAKKCTLPLVPVCSANRLPVLCLIHCAILLGCRYLTIPVIFHCSCHWIS